MCVNCHFDRIKLDDEPSMITCICIYTGGEFDKKHARLHSAVSVDTQRRCRDRWLPLWDMYCFEAWGPVALPYPAYSNERPVPYHPGDKIITRVIRLSHG